MPPHETGLLGHVAKGDGVERGRPAPPRALGAWARLPAAARPDVRVRASRAHPPRRVQHDPAPVEEEHAVAGTEHAVRPLLGDDDGCSGGLSTSSIELPPPPRDRAARSARRAVAARLEREHRGEADALELAAGELGHAPVREVSGADRVEGAARARGKIKARRRADVLEPEGDLGGDPREARPGPRDPGRGWPRRRRAPQAWCCVCRPGDLDPAAEGASVEMRHEPGERAQQATTCLLREDRAARPPRPARARARHCRAPAPGPPGSEKRQVLDPR